MYHGPDTLLSSISESSPLIIISAPVCKVDIAPLPLHMKALGLRIVLYLAQAHPTSGET